MVYKPDWDVRVAQGERCERAVSMFFGRDGDLTFEVKDDAAARKWSNACLEFWQTDPNGGLKPSGLAITKADYWFHRYYGGTYDGHYLLTPVRDLRLIAEEFQLARGKSLEPNDLPLTGDNGNRSVCIPLAELVLPWKWLHDAAIRKAAA